MELFLPFLFLGIIRSPSSLTYSMKKILLATFSVVGGVFFVYASSNPGTFDPNGFNPGAALGLNTGSNSGISGVISLVQNVIASLVPILVSLAVLAFFWYIVQFIWKGGESAEKKNQAVKGMAYSILALFVMVSIWGIIAFFGTTLGIGQGGDMPGFIPPGTK